MKARILRANLYIGIFFLAGATLLLILNQPFIKTWYYVFAWWAFILILDSLNYRNRGSSPLSEDLSDFLFLAFLSVCVWLVFELFNLRLNNWSYFDLPPSRFSRWLGYFLAFATVIPALKELSLLFQFVRGRKRSRLFRLRVTPLFLRGSAFLGGLGVVLILVWPRIFFPLLWVSLVFLVEPLNYRLRIGSLLTDLETNDWSRFIDWILAGLAAGFFWEFWNFWAGSRWEYTLPYLDFWHIFQMPVFGYIGFLPFALEIFAVQNLLLDIRKKTRKSFSLSVLMLAFLVIYCCVCFYLMDLFTVVH
ncbi:MAG: hypothetical protein PVI11_07155 [Candidatus Aminicenantes bacterium]|jgi:hypothetical protein